MELTRKGDKLRGQKVSIEAMKIEKKGVFRRTGAHEGQYAVAERNVLCVIEKEMVKAKTPSTRPASQKQDRL